MAGRQLRPSGGQPVIGSLYDLLGVAPTATPDEIRTAWRTGIAQLDPTDRRFGLLNDAAGVLLDNDKRAAYDEALGPASAVEPVETQAAQAQPAPRDMPVVLPVGVATDALPLIIRRIGGRRGLVPSWLLIVLAALTAVIGAGAIALATLVPSSDQLADATSEAEAAAQQSVTTIFSYDYTRLDADQAAADAYLTPAYRSKEGGFDDLFELIKQNAPGIKLKVEAQFVASGLVRTGEGDGGSWFGNLGEGQADRVQVLVMFDQVKTSAGSTQPVTFRNFATLTMQRVGGSWLVDGIAGPPVQN